MDLTEQFKEELTAIKKAPLTFAIGFLALAGMIFFGEYSLIFKEWISQKESIIHDKESIINDKNNQIQDMQRQLTAAKHNEQAAPANVPTTGRPIKKVRQSAANTGPAISFGDQSPANTGTIGTLSIDSSAQRQKK